MQKSTNHLITDDIPSLLKQIAIPASVGMFFNTMYNVVDTFYAGLISTTAVAAMSLSFMIYFLIIGFGYGFSSAITALIGNAYGRKKHLLASIYAHKGLVFIPLIGILLSIIGYIISPWLFKLLGASNEYLELCLTYMYTILGGVIFFSLNFSLNAILVAKGDTKTYRNTLIFGFFANMALNPLFIYGFLFIPAFGFKGIALATVFIQVINMLYMFKKVLDTKIIHFHNLDYYLPNKKIYMQFIKQGTPASLNMLTMAFGSLILTYFVSHYGVKAVAGYGIGFRVEQIMLLPALGLSTAVLTLVSNNFGARLYDRVELIVKTALKYGFAISAFGIVFLLLFGHLISSLFTHDLEVVNYSMNYLVIEVWIFFAYVVLFVCVSTLQAIKQPKMIFYVGLYRQIVAKFLISYVLVKYFELDYIYLFVGILVMIYSAGIFMYFYTKNRLKVMCK